MDFAVVGELDDEILFAVLDDGAVVSDDGVDHVAEVDAVDLCDEHVLVWSEFLLRKRVGSDAEDQSLLVCELFFAFAEG